MSATAAHQPGWVRFASALAVAWGLATAVAGAGMIGGAIGGHPALVLGSLLLGVGAVLAIVIAAFNGLSAIVHVAFSPRGEKSWEIRLFLTGVLAGVLSTAVAVVATAAVAGLLSARLGGGFRIDLGVLLSVAVRGTTFWAGWLAVGVWALGRLSPEDGSRIATAWAAVAAGVLGVSAGFGWFTEATAPMTPNSGVTTGVIAFALALVLGGGGMAWLGWSCPLTGDDRPGRRLLVAGLLGCGAGLTACVGEGLFLYIATTPMNPSWSPDWAPDPQEVGLALELAMTTAPAILVAGALVAVLGLRALTLPPPGDTSIAVAAEAPSEEPPL